MSQPNNLNIPITKNGFTAVEVLIIAPIVVLVIGIFITLIVNMTGQVLATKSANTLTYNIQDALNLIEQDVKSSNSYLATNNISLISPQGYDNATADFRNIDNGTMLILSNYATTSSPLSPDRNIVYSLNTPNACNSAQIDQNAPMPINIIYFVKDKTLWRRTIMPSNYTDGCDATTKLAVIPWQQPTCSPTAPSGDYCKTQDTKLVDGIVDDGGFSINYYTKADTTNPDPIANNPTSTDEARSVALQSVTTVSVNITATNTAAGRDVSRSGIIRAVIPKDNIANSPYNSYQNTILADNPIGYWSLNETSGTTALDISGRNANGIYAGGTNLNQPGALSATNNYAVKFNGPSSPTRVSTPSDTIWNRSNGQELTIEAWINPNWTSSYGDILSNRINISTNPNWELYQYSTDGSLQLHGSSQYKSTYTPPNNVWTYIVATVDSAGNSKLYANGLVVQTTTGYTYGPNTNSSLTIGAATPTGNEPYAGTIDEAAIYDRALSAAEISQHYAARTLP